MFDNKSQYHSYPDINVALYCMLLCVCVCMYDCFHLRLYEHLILHTDRKSSLKARDINLVTNICMFIHTYIHRVFAIMLM